MKVLKKFVLLLIAAALGVATVVVVTGIELPWGTGPVHILTAVLLALLVVGAVGLLLKAVSARQSNVIEHGPEMSTLAFPPSSFRK